MGMVEAHARWPWRLHLQLRGSSSFFSVSMPAPMASSFLHRTTCPISRFICPPCFPASANATAAANPVFLPHATALFMRFAAAANATALLMLQLLLLQLLLLQLMLQLFSCASLV